MTGNGYLAVRSPSDDLRERLDDPKVAAALRDVLDHADLLALFVTAADGFFRRGDEIMDSVAGGVSDLRGAFGHRPAALADVDLPGLVAGLTTLSKSVAGAAPTLGALLGSSLMTDVRTAPTLAMLGEALVEATEVSAKEPVRLGGVGGVLRALKDEDVRRGIGLLVHLARAVGRKLA